MQLATKQPIRKVQASAASGAVGAALAQIVIWALQAQGLAVPDGVQMAITTVVVALAALVAGYLTPLRAEEVYGEARE